MHRWTTGELSAEVQLLLYDFSADRGENDLHVFDLYWIDVKDVLRENSKICELAGGDGAFDVVLALGIR
jgi:hypothetical protein